MAGLSVGFVVMWSSGFIGARLGTAAASTLSLMSWRFLALALVVLVAFMIVATMAPRGLRLSPSSWPQQAGGGVLSQVVYLAGTVGAVEYGVGAGTAAIIAALQPLLTGALAGLLLGERVTVRQWVGLAIGFVGVTLVVGGDLGAGSAPGWAYTLPFLGMLGLVAATLIEARAPTRLPIWEQLGVQCATSAIVFAVLAALAGDLIGTHLTEIGFWLAVAWFVVFSTLGGYGFYWLTLRRTDATKVSTLIYLTPPTTAAWAWLMFGDTLTTTAVLGFAVCALGVTAVFLRRTPARAHA